MKFITNYPRLCNECRAVISRLAELYESGIMADTDDPEAPFMYAADQKMLCGGRVCASREADGAWAEPPWPVGYDETDDGHRSVDHFLEDCWWFHDTKSGLYIFDPGMPDDPITEFDQVHHDPTRELWKATADWFYSQGNPKMMLMLQHLRENHGRHIAQVPRDRREWTGEAFAIKWS